MANIPTLTDEERAQLLQRQFQTAMAGSEALQIHLGKAYLNQHDKAHLVLEAIPYTDRTIEELVELLELRAKEAADQVLLTQLNESMIGLDHDPVDGLIQELKQAGFEVAEVAEGAEATLALINKAAAPKRTRKKSTSETQE